MQSVLRHLAAIIASDQRHGRPVEKIRNFDIFLIYCLLYSLGTGQRTLAQCSLREFSISCPPCVKAGKAGKADFVYFLIYWSVFFVLPIYNETAWTTGFSMKNMLPDLIFH